MFEINPRNQIKEDLKYTKRNSDMFKNENERVFQTNTKVHQSNSHINRNTDANTGKTAC